MIVYRQGRTLTDAVLALKLLTSVDQYYPSFNYWFVNKVMSSLLVGDDVMVMAFDHNDLVGVALGRVARPKLRCVRVAPHYQGRGTGIHLIERVLLQLSSERPVCTVCEELMNEFSRPLVNYFGFHLSKVERDLYRKGSLEYVFNAVAGDSVPP